MDLYEALKAGTSEKELLEAFHKDLEAANARITAETEKAANEEYLTDCRECLAEAIIKYAEVLLNEDLNESLSVESIVETFKEFEKELERTFAFSKKLNKIFEKTKSEDKEPAEIKITTRFTNDDDIITKFLKSLK